MRTVAGVDLSLTGTGVIILGETGAVLARETIKTTTAMPHRQRLVYIADTLCSIINRYQPVGIVKEAPAFGATWAVNAIGEVHGAVDYAMEKAGFPVPVAVSPSTLKKFATGRGVGEKGDVKLWILDRWNEKFSDNNQSDAYVLGRIAGNLAGFFPMTSRHEGECLKTILKGNGFDAEAKLVKLIKKDIRTCACGKRMRTGIEMESGKCAACLHGDAVTDATGMTQDERGHIG